MHIERNRIESNGIELDTPIFLGDTINASYLCNVKTIGHPHFQRRFRHEADTKGSRRIAEETGVDKCALTFPFQLNSYNSEVSATLDELSKTALVSYFLPPRVTQGLQTRSLSLHAGGHTCHPVQPHTRYLCQD